MKTPTLSLILLAAIIAASNAQESEQEAFSKLESYMGAYAPFAQLFPEPDAKLQKTLEVRFTEWYQRAAIGSEPTLSFTAPRKVEGEFPRARIVIPITEGTGLWNVVRFVNWIERSAPYSRVESLLITRAEGAPTPRQKRMADGELVTAKIELSGFCAPPPIRAEGIVGQLEGWRGFEKKLLSLATKHVLWSQKLSRLCVVLKSFPEVWVRRIQIHLREGLKLDLSCRGAESKSTLARVRVALRLDSVFGAGLGDPSLQAPTSEQLPSGEREVVLTIPLERGSAFRLPEKPAPEFEPLSKAHRAGDLAGCAKAWQALDSEAKSKADPALLLVAAHALLSAGELDQAQDLEALLLHNDSFDPRAQLLRAQIRLLRQARMRGEPDPRLLDAAKRSLCRAAALGAAEAFAIAQRSSLLFGDKEFMAELIGASSQFQTRRQQPCDPFNRDRSAEKTR